MADQNNQSQKGDGKNNSFTVDSEKTGVMEIPSVTRLLNRKKLNDLKEAEGLKPASPPPPPPAASSRVATTEIEKPNIDTQNMFASGSSSNEAAPQEAHADEISLGDAPSQVEIQSSEAPVASLGEISLTPPEGTEEQAPPVATTPPPSGPAEISLEPSTEALALETPSMEPEVPSAPSAPLELSIEPSPEPQAQVSTPTPPAAAAPQSQQVSTNTKIKRITSPRARLTAPIQKLIVWEGHLLSSSPDPLASAITELQKEGMSQGLFLALTLSANSKLPIFTATAAVTPEHKHGVWEGLRWNPEVAPEVWNQFVKVGIVEFPAAGTNTSQTSSRNLTRSAFGISSDEYLSFVRVGPMQQCRGVLAVVSKQSMRAEIEKTLTKLNQIAQKKAA